MKSATMSQVLKSHALPIGSRKRTRKKSEQPYGNFWIDKYHVTLSDSPAPDLEENLPPQGNMDGGKRAQISVRELLLGLARYLSMKSRLALVISLSLFLVSGSLLAAPVVTEDAIRTTLAAHAVPLHGAGEARLLAEARSHEFFLLGELHGEHEIPELMKDLWPQLWAAGYRHVAGELSPWAVEHLDQAKRLWTQDQAALVDQFTGPKQHIVWGCDIDEGQPERLVADTAKLNPEDATLKQMVALTAQGYNRKQAPQLLSLSETDHPAKDITIGGISLWSNLRQTLRVEALRKSRRQAWTLRSQGVGDEGTFP